jgi:tetratricopeptide (TPR) repeat protein
MSKKLLKIFNIKKIMKKLLGILILSLLFFNTVNAEERKIELDKLFDQLKNTKNLSSAKIVENKILEIWLIHPLDNRRGFRLTALLNQGSRLMNKRQFSKAYEIFTQVIAEEPDWAEAWNKRATVLYTMGQYQSSLDDIKITLNLEPRHFGALSGQALNYIELNQYEKAIKSYKDAQKIYPIMDGAKKMIPELKELIKDLAI